MGRMKDLDIAIQNGMTMADAIMEAAYKKDEATIFARDMAAMPKIIAITFEAHNAGPDANGDTCLPFVTMKVNIPGFDLDVVVDMNIESFMACREALLQADAALDSQRDEHDDPVAEDFDALGF